MCVSMPACLCEVCAWCVCVWVCKCTRLHVGGVLAVCGGDTCTCVYVCVWICMCACLHVGVCSVQVWGMHARMCVYVCEHVYMWGCAWCMCVGDAYTCECVCMDWHVCMPAYGGVPGACGWGCMHVCVCVCALIHVNTCVCWASNPEPYLC